MIFVGRIFLVREHDDARRDEARDVVHVTVRVVTHASLAEPDGVRDAQVLRETRVRSPARSSPGLRTCTSDSSHSSVTSSVPRPSVSMPPPSSTRRSPLSGRTATMRDRAP